MGYVAPRRDHVVEDVGKMRRERLILVLVLLIPTLAAWAVLLFFAALYVLR